MKCLILESPLHASVVDAWRLDFDGSDPGGEGPCRQMTVAHDLAVALVIEAVTMVVDPVGDFGLNSLSQELLRSLAQNLGEDIFGLGQWHEANIGGRKTQGGVLLCCGGTLVDLDTPRVRRPFQPAIHKIRSYPLSASYLTLEIRQTYAGMIVAIPPRHWKVFGRMSVEEFAQVLKEMASRVSLAKYGKHPRAPKKKAPARGRYKHGEHIATSRVLAARKSHK